LFEKYQRGGSLRVAAIEQVYQASASGTSLALTIAFAGRIAIALAGSVKDW